MSPWKVLEFGRAENKGLKSSTKNTVATIDTGCPKIELANLARMIEPPWGPDRGSILGYRREGAQLRELARRICALCYIVYFRYFFFTSWTMPVLKLWPGMLPLNK